MRKILLGTTVYGGYINTFFNYCIPSLLSDGNFPALSKQRRIIINIHTDLAGNHLLMNRMMEIDNIEFSIMVDVIKDENKYDQLGRHQNADLREAKKIGADYHCLMPDFIYSSNCFSNILKLSHKAVCRLVLSASMESISPELNNYRSDGILSIRAEDLATLALKYMHPGTKQWLATKNDYPSAHVLVWEGKNTLHMCSPHCTPVYIANEVINSSGNLSSPLDGILDKVIFGDIYCTKPDDQIVIAEVSNDSGRSIDNKRVDAQEFCRIMKWDTTGSFRQLAVFNSETIDPICRKMLGDKWWNDVEISVEKNKIVGTIMHSMGVENAEHIR